MTREEAINQLKELIILHQEQHGWGVSTIKALEKAIKALEQNPKYRKEAKRWKNKALEQKPCEDAVSREYVIEELNKINGTEEIFKVHEIIENAPSVQPKRIKGEWIESKYSEICSECKAPILCDNNEYVVYSNYCPNCGAKMSESEVME